MIASTGPESDLWFRPSQGSHKRSIVSFPYGIYRWGARAWARRWGMELSFAIFILGTVASFFPMYWVLERLTSTLRRHRGGRSTPLRQKIEAKNHFLNCLRQEAIDRIEAALVEAAADARPHSSNKKSLDDRLGILPSTRLRELRTAVVSLFPAEAVREFDNVVATLQHRPRQDNSAIEQIRQLKSTLARGLDVTGRDPAAATAAG